MKTRTLAVIMLLAGVLWLATVWGVFAWLAPGVVDVDTTTLLPTASDVQEQEP